MNQNNNMFWKQCRTIYEKKLVFQGEVRLFCFEGMDF